MHIACFGERFTYSNPFDETHTQSTPKSELKCNFWGVIEVIMQLGFLFNLRALQKLVKGRK